MTKLQYDHERAAFTAIEGNHSIHVPFEIFNNAVAMRNGYYRNYGYGPRVSLTLAHQEMIDSERWLKSKYDTLFVPLDEREEETEMTRQDYWHTVTSACENPLTALEDNKQLFFMDSTTGITSALWKCKERGGHYHIAILSNDDYFLAETKLAKDILQVLPLDYARIRIVTEGALVQMKEYYQESKLAPEIDASTGCDIFRHLLF